MTIDARCKRVEELADGISWYMMNTKDYISTINFVLKIENNDLVSFKGQTNTF